MAYVVLGEMKLEVFCMCFAFLIVEWSSLAWLQMFGGAFFKFCGSFIS